MWTSRPRADKGGSGVRLLWLNTLALPLASGDNTAQALKRDLAHKTGLLNVCCYYGYRRFPAWVPDAHPPRLPHYGSNNWDFFSNSCYSVFWNALSLLFPQENSNFSLRLGGNSTPSPTWPRQTIVFSVFAPTLSFQSSVSEAPAPPTPKVPAQDQAHW